MTISGHKIRCVFDRYNIVSREDLKEVTRKRQVFNELQTVQLRDGYDLFNTGLLQRKKATIVRL